MLSCTKFLRLFHLLINFNWKSDKTPSHLVSLPWDRELNLPPSSYSIIWCMTPWIICTPTPQPTNPHPQPNLLPPPSTPSASPTHYLPTLYFSVGSSSPVVHAPPPFAVPTLSPADWYHLNQFAPFIQTNAYQPTSPLPVPISRPTVRPMNRRGRPPKVRLIPVHTPSEGSILASTSPADNTNTAPLSSQSADLVGQCWFIQREDKRSDMDIVAMWCSDFDNFSNGEPNQNNWLGRKSHCSWWVTVIPNKKDVTARRRWVIWLWVSMSLCWHLCVA